MSNIYTFNGNVQVTRPTNALPFTFSNQDGTVSDDLVLLYDNAAIMTIHGTPTQATGFATIPSLPMIMGGTYAVTSDAAGNIRTSLPIAANRLVGSDGTELVPIRAGTGLTIDGFNGVISLAGVAPITSTSIIVDDPNVPGHTEITDTQYFSTDGTGQNIVLDSTIPGLSFQYAFNPLNTRTYTIHAINNGGDVDLTYTYEGTEFFRFYGDPVTNGAVFEATALPLVTLANPTGILVNDADGNVASTNGPLPAALGGIGIAPIDLVPDRILGTSDVGTYQLFEGGTGISIDSTTGIISTSFDPFNPSFGNITAESITVDTVGVPGSTVITDNSVLTSNGAGQSVEMNSSVPQVRLTDTVGASSSTFDMRTVPHLSHLDLEFAYNGSGVPVMELHGTPAPTSMTIPGLPTQTITGTGVVVHNAIGDVGRVAVLPPSLGGTGSSSFNPTNPTFNSITVDNPGVPGSTVITDTTTTISDGTNTLTLSPTAINAPGIAPLTSGAATSVIARDATGNYAPLPGPVPIPLGGTNNTGFTPSTVVGVNGVGDQLISYTSGGNITFAGNSINTVANPLFTSIVAGSGTITTLGTTTLNNGGTITTGTINSTGGGTNTFAGPISGSTVNATNGNFTNLTATNFNAPNPTFTGTVTAGAFNATTGPNSFGGTTTFAGAVSGQSGTFTQLTVASPPGGESTVINEDSISIIGAGGTAIISPSQLTIPSLGTQAPANVTGILTRNALGDVGFIADPLPVSLGGSGTDGGTLTIGRPIGYDGTQFVSVGPGTNIVLGSNTIAVSSTPNFTSVSTGTLTASGLISANGGIDANGGTLNNVTFTNPSFSGPISATAFNATTGPNTFAGTTSLTNANVSGTLSANTISNPTFTTPGVITNNGSGVFSSTPVLPVSLGGTNNTSFTGSSLTGSNAAGTQLISYSIGPRLTITGTTLDVVDNPSFTTITTTGSITSGGTVSAPSFSGGTFSGTTGTFSGLVAANGGISTTTLAVSGAISGSSASFSNNVSAASFTATTGPNSFAGTSTFDNVVINGTFSAGNTSFSSLTVGPGTFTSNGPAVINNTLSAGATTVSSLQVSNLTSAGVVLNDAGGNLTTSPTVPVARGGTGLTAVPATNTLLGSSGSAFIPFSAGNNIVITNNGTTGSIAVSSTPSFDNITTTNAAGTNSIAGVTTFSQLVTANGGFAATAVTTGSLVVDSATTGYSEITDTTITTYNTVRPATNDQFVQLNSGAANPGVIIQDRDTGNVPRTFAINSEADTGSIDLRIVHEGVVRMRINGNASPTTLNIPSINTQLVTAPTRILGTNASGDVGSINFASNSYIATNASGAPISVTPGANALVGTNGSGVPTAIIVGNGLTLSGGTLSSNFASANPTFTDGYNIVDSNPGPFPMMIPDPGTPYYTRVAELSNVPPNVLTTLVTIQTTANYSYQINLQLVRRPAGSTSSPVADGIQITSWRVTNVGGTVTVVSTGPQLNRTDGNANATLVASGANVNLQGQFGGNYAINFEILRVSA